MSDTGAAQQGQGDVATPAVMDNSCPFCGGDPYHRTDLGEPVAVTCCETACALWDSRDEDTVEIDRADLIAISNRLRESRILETENERLRTLLSSSRGEQGWRTIDSAPKDGTHIIGNTQWGAREIWWHKDAYEGEYWTDEGDSEPEPTGWIPKPGDAPSAPGSVPTSLAQGQLHWVACERCGGSGEVEVRPSVGPYDDPTTCAEICSACDGTGRFCEETHPAERDDDLAVPTSLAGQVPDPEEYRDTFSGIVQGGCEACGDCDDDENGECACDRIVNELIAATQRINEEASPQPTAGGDAPTEGELGDEGVGVVSFSGKAEVMVRKSKLDAAVSTERARVIEECAKWHDEQAATQRRKADASLRWDRHVKATTHEESAAALRALGQQDTGGADHG